MTDRCGQIWMLGFDPYAYHAIIVRSDSLSSTLSVHAFVRIEGSARAFDVEESSLHPLERRSDMRRVA